MSTKTPDDVRTTVPRTPSQAATQPSHTLGPTLIDRLAQLALILGALLTTSGFILAFTTAPLASGGNVSVPALIGNQMVTAKLLLSQKIFYFHVPVAIVSFGSLFFTAFYGLRFLLKHNPAHDLQAKTSAEVSLVFILMTMASGTLWERFDWGVWWTWEPRLTTYLILMLLVIAYFILRKAIDDPERRAVFASVFGIIAFVDAPVSFLITRLVPNGTHPVVFRSDVGLPPGMLLPFLLALLGMLMVAFALYRLRLRERRLRELLDAMKATLDD